MLLEKVESVLISIWKYSPVSSLLGSEKTAEKEGLNIEINGERRLFTNNSVGGLGGRLRVSSLTVTLRESFS